MQPTIEDVFVQPDLRRKRITVNVSAQDTDIVDVCIVDTPHFVSVSPGTFTLDFPEHALWSPDSPSLYTLRCTPKSDDVAGETLEVAFGIRDLTIKDQRFFLNQRPAYLRGIACRVLDAAELKNDLAVVRGAGFSFVEFDGVPPVEAVAECDRLGLMVWVPLPREVSEAVATVIHLRGHPSVVAWLLQADDAALLDAVRERDPSRLIFGERGRAHYYVRPYHAEQEPYRRIAVESCGPVDRVTRLYLQNCGESGVLNLIVGLGVGTIPNAPGDARHDAFVQGFQDHALDRVGGDVARMIEASEASQGEQLRALLDSIQANGKLAGYCLAPARDGAAPESSGLVDASGHTKAAAEALVSPQGDLYAIVQMSQRNLTVRQEVAVSITMLNHARVDGRADLSLQVVGPTNQVLWKKKRGVKIPKSGRELWSGTVSASGSTGRHRFVVRMLQGMTPLTEASVEFDVFEAVSPWPEDVNVLDPEGRWKEAWGTLIANTGVYARVHVVTPAANTIRSYSDNDLGYVLGQVREGAVAIVFNPPDDWNEFAETLDEPVYATSVPCRESQRSVSRYAKLHPIFDGLPARGVMDGVYAGVAPCKTFTEASVEDICGVYRVNSEGAATWHPDILVQRYGSGQLVFTHLRIFERMPYDPVAQRLFVNMLAHFSRRSVPSTGTVPVHQGSVEWLREQKNHHIRRWMVIGMFPGGDGSRAYPPEESLDLDATYPGWYRAVSWQPVYSLSRDEHRVPLREVLGSGLISAESLESGVAYAHTELICERRGRVALFIESEDGIAAWLNGKPLEMTETGAGAKAEAMLREGRNRLLLKLSARNGPHPFRVVVTPEDASFSIRWWK